VDYLPYQLVILDDVPADRLRRGAARAQSLRRRLRWRLVATGDTLREESLAGGDLEKALPVKFVPQPPPAVAPSRSRFIYASIRVRTR